MRDVQQYDGMVALELAGDYLSSFADMVHFIKTDNNDIHVPNVLLNGLHGTGKTSIIKQICDERNLNLTVLTGATLDPFLHLLGVPITKELDNETVLEFLRSKDIGLDEADVVFIDEVNRSPRETRNALLEIMLNKSLNGVSLPNLKWCVAAINPIDLYTDTFVLDYAMIDRFPVKLTTPPILNKSILAKCGVKEEIANAFDLWWNGEGKEGIFSAGRDMVSRMNRVVDSEEKMLLYISPRTMTEAALAYQNTKSDDVVKLFFATNEQRELMQCDLLLALLNNIEEDTVNALGGNIQASSFIEDFEEVVTSSSKLQAFHANMVMNRDNTVLMESISNSLVRHYMTNGEFVDRALYLLNQLPDEFSESVKARIGSVGFED